MIRQKNAKKNGAMMIGHQFDKTVDDYKNYINENLEKFLPTHSLCSPTIDTVMHYSLLAGGKRLRPMLCLAVYEMFTGNNVHIIPVACALEFIHTYSLIHDDLPCMDDDDFRRGLPTCHKKFGEAYAVLAGDCFLTEAFGLIAQWHEAPTVAILLKEVVSACGSEGLIGGQWMDIVSENKSVSEETLQGIHKNKTGKLIVASVRLGAICGNATPKELEMLTGYAKLLGLAFQIQDDILDVVGSKEQLGKNVGQDSKLNKATFPALYGLDESKKKLTAAVEEANGYLEYFGEKSWFLQDLTRYIADRVE